MVLRQQVDSTSPPCGLSSLTLSHFAPSLQLPSSLPLNGENGVNTETPSMVCHVEAITDACIDTKPSVSSMSTSLRHGQRHLRMTVWKFTQNSAWGTREAREVRSCGLYSCSHEGGNTLPQGAACPELSLCPSQSSRHSAFRVPSNTLCALEGLLLLLLLSCFSRVRLCATP